MNNPSLTIIPRRGALRDDLPTTLDVLLRITPPEVSQKESRPDLNLGLVIDRSGSMAGARLHNAIDACCQLVSRLSDQDRISVTIFDDAVDVLVPNSLAKERKAVERALRTIEARSNTDLHQGWVEGGLEVGRHLAEGRLNRVLVLSDGHTNMGLCEPKTICSHVQQLCHRGVSTSTLGLGDGYNEDLLSGMADAGDGNFYNIAHPGQISDILDFELSGLASTFGLSVALGIKPAPGVELVKVLNNLEQTDDGRLKLANLVRGRTIEVVLRLQVPASQEEADLCSFQLQWTDPETDKSGLIGNTLRLPRVKATQMSEFPASQEVARQVALQLAAEAEREAVRQIDQRNLGVAQKVVEEALGRLREAPSAPEVELKVSSLERLIHQIKAGDNRSARKSAYSGSYYSSKSLHIPELPPR